MTNEDKKAATIKRAEENKANFDLHQQLIKQHIEFDIGDLKKASVEYFLENGRPTGGFLLALMAYAEDYHKTKVKNISSNSMLADVKQEVSAFLKLLQFEDDERIRHEAQRLLRLYFC